MYRAVWRENQSEIAVREWEKTRRLTVKHAHSRSLFWESLWPFSDSPLSFKTCNLSFSSTLKTVMRLTKTVGVFRGQKLETGLQSWVNLNFFTTLCCVWLFWPSQLLHKNQQKIWKLYQYHSKFLTESWWERRRDRNINCSDRRRGRPSELQSCFSGASRDEW